jgi:hypothetical protein
VALKTLRWLVAARGIGVGTAQAAELQVLQLKRRVTRMNQQQPVEQEEVNWDEEMDYGCEGTEVEWPVYHEAIIRIGWGVDRSA